MTICRSTALGTLCCAPLVAAAFLYAFAGIAYAKMGHWPLYCRPDPKELQLPILHFAALLSYPAAVLSIGAGLFALMLAPDRWDRRRAAVFLAGAAIWALSVEPAMKLLHWLVD